MNETDRAVMIEPALAAAAAGDGFRATGLVRELLAAGQPLAEHWARLTRLCAELDDDDAALGAARCLWQQTPKSVPTAFILARALEATGRAEEAVAVLAPAARAGQLSLMELYRLSRMLMFAGRLDEAEALVRGLLEQEPSNPSLWERYAQLHDFRAGEPEIDRLHRLQHELANAPFGSRIAAAWALAKAVSDCGDDAGAATVLDYTAALRRESLRFDPDALDAAANASLAALDDTQLAQAGDPEHRSARVVFVLGPPRSGTTLVEQILSRHPRIAGGGELKFLPLMRHALGDFTRSSLDAFVAGRGQRGTDPWDGIRERYLALGDERFGVGACFTDKMLTNHLRLAVIRRAFPRASVVRCRRDPLDVAWSLWRSSFGADTPWIADPAWIARYIVAYERVMDQWAERFPGWIVNVDYEDLVADPDWEIARLLRACGLEDDPATRHPERSGRAVSTLSFAQVRRPIGTGQVGAANRFPYASRGLREALERSGLRYRE
ncbi:MAG: hypothetical protein CALGDGBN_01310 [Pseudomonadales bacterium]|nr:hypothetical protein [Pseudomonadales bacterium]